MKTKNHTIDTLRILMAVLVIMLHSALVLTKRNLVEFILFEGVCRIAVPFFFVVSGFYLESTIKKGNINLWLSKIVKMYILWSLLYIPFQIHLVDAILDKNIDDINFESIPFDMLFGYWQLWFLPAIIMGALLVNTYHSSNKNILICSIMLFIFACIVSYLTLSGRIVREGFWGTPYALRNGVFFAFPLMTLGYLISKNKEKILVKKHLSSKYALIIAFILVVVESSFYFYTAKGLYDFTISSAIISVCLVAFAVKNPDLLKLNLNGTDISHGLYMVHVGFYLIVSRYIRDFYILFPIVLFLSICLTLVINKMNSIKIGA